MKMVSVCRNQNKAKFAKQSGKKKYSNFHFAAVLMIYMTVAISFRQGKVQKLLIMLPLIDITCSSLMCQ